MPKIAKVKSKEKVPEHKGKHKVPAQKGTHGVSAQKGKHGVPAQKGKHGVSAQKGKHEVPAQKGKKGVPAKKGKPAEKGKQRLPSKNLSNETTRNDVSGLFSSRKSFVLGWPDSDNASSDEGLLMLTNVAWDVFKVSPLFGFVDTEIHRKHYSLQLRNYLVTLDTDETLEYSAKFHSLRSFGGGQNITLQVCVWCSAEGKQKLVYVGFFLKWHWEGNSSILDTEDVLHLPILLCKGQTAIRKRVHDALQFFFDCRISPLYFSQFNLIWLNSMFLSVSEEGNPRQMGMVTFVLHAPGNMDKPLKCQCSLGYHNVKALWNRIHPGDSEYIAEEDVNKLYNGIIESISDTLKIKLNSFHIVQINYPTGRVRFDGKVLCKTNEMMAEFLKFMCSEPESQFLAQFMCF